MALFRRKPNHPEPLGDESIAIDGTPMPAPPQPGDRRLRLVGECKRAVALTGLGSPESFMSYFGPGYGLEVAVAAIDQVLAAEQSSLELAALRGAGGYLAVNSDGFGLFPLANGWKIEHDTLVLAEPTSVQADTDLGAALWMCATAEAVAFADPALSKLGQNDLAKFRHSHSIDYTKMKHLLAWTSVAIARLESVGQLDPVLDQLGPASRINGAGWYTDPMYQIGYRWHDGSDWTDRCWVRHDDGSINEGDRPLSSPY